MPWHRGSDRSPIVKSTNTLELCCYREWQKDGYPLLPYGMMSGPSPEGIFEDKSTLYTADSHARISAVRDLERAWKRSEAAYFLRSCAWPKKFDPHSYSLRTSLEYANTCTSLQGKWPRYGMIVGGVCYPLTVWEHRIKGKDGFVWPTPNVPNGGRVIPEDAEWSGMAAYKNGKKMQVGLESAVRRWPTARDWKHESMNSGLKRNTPTLPTHAKISCGNPGGQLNPTWVEWLMGYPLEWTELKPWAMRLFPRKCPKHLKG